MSAHDIISGRADHHIEHGEALAVLRSLPDSCVDAVVTDPPYFKVKGEAWDRQWDKPAQFIAWIGELCDQWRRVLKPNGSLYVFASPAMAFGVEGAVVQHLQVLQRITWAKPDPSCSLNSGAGGGGRMCKESMRQFWTRTENIIFAEHYGADNMAKGEAGYEAKCDELRGFVFEPLRAYIVGEFERAGMNTQEGKIAANVACGFSASPGGMASRHYFSRSQWYLPTPEHYQALRDLLNTRGGEYLRKEYEELRKEYEELRKEYEELRRPFSVSADVPYTDVWTFPTVQAYPGKHVCEKPLAMMEHIIKASTRPNALVLDCFAGSATTGHACANLGRRFLGVELDAHWCEKGRARIEQAKAPKLEQRRLFA